VAGDLEFSKRKEDTSARYVVPEYFVRGKLVCISVRAVISKKNMLYRAIALVAMYALLPEWFNKMQSSLPEFFTLRDRGAKAR
jgi:hypothetical protein